jgi:hypothetical protein
MIHSKEISSLGRSAGGLESWRQDSMYHGVQYVVENDHPIVLIRKHLPG